MSGTIVYFSAARPNVRRLLNRADLKPPLVAFTAKASDVRAPELHAVASTQLSDRAALLSASA